MSKVIFSIGRFITRHYYLRKVKIKIMGRIPKKAAIIVANHDNPWDPPLIMISTRRMIHFFTSGLLFKNLLRGGFLKLSEQIPAQSGLKEVNKRAFSKASYYLKKGEMVGIFPYPFDMVKKRKVLYTGVIKLIIENDAPIIPVKVKVNEKRKWKSFFDVNFDKVYVIIGKPIKGFREKCKKGMLKKCYLDLTNELMEKINSLKC